jgi:hypothetical protein
MLTVFQVKAVNVDSVLHLCDLSSCMFLKKFYNVWFYVDVYKRYTELRKEQSVL